MLQEKNEDVGNAKGLLINTYDSVTCVISGITNVELFLMDMHSWVMNTCYILWTFCYVQIDSP